MMFRRPERAVYQYAPGYEPVEGVYNSPVPPVDSAAQMAYYEFSKATRNVWLFPMLWNDEVSGVLSIDTYSDDRWTAAQVSRLKLMANLGAIAIRQVGFSAPGLGPGREDGGAPV